MLGMETAQGARPTTSSGCVPDALELDDAAVVVAAVGTTSTTSVDPVAAIAERCAAAGTWLHVDAAYAGSAMVCPEFRWAFEGVEQRRLPRRQCAQVAVRADGLLAALDAPARTSSATRSPSSRSTCARPSEDAFNISEYGPALGRRFRSLKLWAVLRCYGAEGLRSRIREAIRLAELFEGWVREEPGWELCAPRPFSVVCFRKDGSDEENEAILERVNASGEIFISHTKLDGRYVLRLAVGNERTTEEDVRRAWDVLRELR